MNPKPTVLVALPTAALAVAAALYFSIVPGFEKVAVAPAAPPAVPVVAGVVNSHDVPIYLRGVGTVIAYNTDVVRSQITGELTEIAFTEGQTVKAGDLLAQIDPRPYQAQLDQVIANRDRDQAQLTNAIANLDRYTQLLSKGYATPQLFDTQKAQVAQLQSAIKADEALIEQAEVQLGYTRLTSPIDGVTGVRQIDVGNIIHPTDPNGLVVVTQIEPISLIFTLPETDLPQIQKQMAKGPLTVLAYSQDDKIKLDEGKLLLVNNQIVQTTGTVQTQGDVSQHRASALAGRAGQCATASRHAARRADRRRAGRAAGPDGLLRLRDRAGRQGRKCAPSPWRRSARDRPSSTRVSRPTRRSWSTVSTGCSRAASCKCCTARPHSKPTCRARSSRQSHEHSRRRSSTGRSRRSC